MQRLFQFPRSGLRTTTLSLVLLLVGVAGYWVYQRTFRPCLSSGQAAAGAPAKPTLQMLADTGQDPQTSWLSRWFGRVAGTPVSDRIQLQGVIISKVKSLAMINSTAVEQGETAAIPLARESLNVRCLEIKPAEVLISCETGETATLLMKQSGE